MIDQTTFYDPLDPVNPNKGNCTEACLASVLGLTLEEVPRLNKGGATADYWDSLEAFLDSKGLWLMTHQPTYHPECIYLATGPSARGCSHMVVMKEGQLLHDPHPSRKGLIRVEHIYLLVPRDLRGFSVKAPQQVGIPLHKGMLLAETGMQSYAKEHPKWWRKVDGTPIPNDLSVHIAQAIADATGGGGSMS